MSDTPRTDAAITRCACSSYVVEPEFAQELERENAALRGTLSIAEDGLRHALMMEPLDPFRRGKIISSALDAVRVAIRLSSDAAMKEGK